jgi:hypothetical protein
MGAGEQTMRASEVRIAMWSGPRNISTAMMRAFGNRDDTVVVDEPLYAHYLKSTDAPHPGADEVITSQETDWRRVVAELTGPIPDGASVWYQKHMSHHLLEGMTLEWLLTLQNAFLIRSPREMLASLAKVLPRPTLADTGLPQQVALYDWLRARGRQPPVVDARDILMQPAHVLGQLCEASGIPFSERMLSWPPGPRATDGVWARHWYSSVTNSDGFAPWQPREVDLPAVVAPLLEPCEGLYARLYAERLC